MKISEFRELCKTNRARAAQFLHDLYVRDGYVHNYLYFIYDHGG